MVFILYYIPFYYYCFFFQKKKKSEAHVIVFQHGFQGSSYDLKLFANNININHMDAIFLHSCSNENDTDCDIEIMGLNLAKEVRQFINAQLGSKKLQRLSFVGHSLGGLIIRSALPHLQDLEQYFHAFITFSTPHLGFMFSQSKMVNAGLWFMKTWNNTYSLKQMTMAETKQIEDTFIYRLAFKYGLKFFKHIILFSSPQDYYVPFYSARMQQTPGQFKDLKNSEIYNQMLEGIFKNVQSDRIHRVDVSFEIPGQTIDNMIGRAAHISFLENEALMKMILTDFKHIFI
ncbi:serine esterase, putative [Ichthyophthirius multifiliis]|uniref:Serine esterase, putative n=1 Tax=Ichthyophthirius multifiliis TaxID=5932 RepID=G0QND3_ICHMU|nr:serine esterase, putative [Ichthyophthirius multifiliis]EGR33266.1 serine esterase, putative [Ichthyophthirius multifiliis]|eukprot:XP_004037252.1 serine esterase, putative [Ichthyophthirius multifiliis]